MTDTVSGHATPRDKQDDRPGGALLAVHSLDHLMMAVPELGEAERFFGAFGLDVVSSPDGLELRCFDADHCWMRVVPGATKRLRELVFGAYGDDLAAHRQHLDRLGIDGLRMDNDGGLSFRDPEGTPIRIVAAAKSSPDIKSIPSAMHDLVPGGRYAAPLRSQAPKVRPRRFSHALFFSSDVERSIAFYSAALGLRLSDEAGGAVAFLHSPHGSDHHLVAFAKESGPGLHHTAWDVGSVQEIGLGMKQMTDAGYGAQGWGLGRHVLGSNFFNYVRDPWDSYAEYSFDIDHIPAGHAWQAGHHSSEDGFYLWGPAPPADFAVNHELSRAEPV